MTKVKIKKGLWYSSTFNGTYELDREFKKSRESKKEGFVWVLIDGKIKKLHVNAKDVVNISIKIIDQKLLEKEIGDRFDVLELLSDSVMRGTTKALMIAGAPGVGKTYTVEKKLTENVFRMHRNPSVVHNVRKGTVSALCLFEELWIHRSHGSVLVLDDMDSVFADQESLNLLKAALDTTAKRTLFWGTQSPYLKEAGIDREFEFNGSVIFITNVNIDRQIAKKSKMSDHFAAVVNRCVFLDLKIHEAHEIIIRMKHVLKNSNILAENGLSEVDGKEIVKWIEKHTEQIRSLSLRTVIHMAAFKRDHGDDWKRIAAMTMLK